MSLVGAKQFDFVAEDAVFERASVLPHDRILRPTSQDSIHLEGSSSNSGVVEYLHVDEDEGVFRHEMKQDVEPYLKQIQAMQSHYGRDAGKNKEGDFYHAARVPYVVLHGWLNARGLKMSDFRGSVVDDFLNDFSNKPFRIWQGRV